MKPIIERDVGLPYISLAMLREQYRLGFGRGLKLMSYWLDSSVQPSHMSLTHTDNKSEMCFPIPSVEIDRPSHVVLHLL